MTNIVFFGTPEFALPSLLALARIPEYAVAMVVTQPDRPQGRSLAVHASPIARAADELHLPLMKAGRLIQNSVCREKIHALKPDVGVVVAYGEIIPPEILEIPRYGIVNIHPSMLPQYRGASPIQTAILNGDHETGVTLMRLDKDLDHGPVVWQTSATIEPCDTAHSLAARLANLGAEILVEALLPFIQGKLVPRAQDHGSATFTKLIKKDDGRINWNSHGAVIERMVRAYDPWPGSWTECVHKGKIIKLKILKARMVRAEGLHEENIRPGGIVGGQFQCGVRCGDGSVLVLESAQPEGKRVISGKEFTNGYQEISNFN